MNEGHGPHLRGQLLEEKFPIHSAGVYNQACGLTRIKQEVVEDLLHK